MNYKVFLNNLLDVDTSIDWTFPFENKEDYFLEINNDVKIYLNELISNVAFSFLSKSLKNDMYRYLVDVRTIENNQVLPDNWWILEWKGQQNMTFAHKVIIALTRCNVTIFIV